MTLNFIEEFTTVVEELNINWGIYGLIDRNERVYSLGDDTKLLSRIFELLAAPVVNKIAEKHNLLVQLASSQVIYPDFTLMTDPKDNDKIAVDVKTTYRRGTYQSGSRKYGYKAGEEKPLKFTLGSYASFLRNNTKNIEFNYKTYDKHYIIGFVYTRNPEAREGNVRPISEKGKIKQPYLDVEYFVQEKYKLAGEKPGSGNTENIGNFPTKSVEELRKGEGPFTDLGEEVFENYWRNYPKYREEKSYTNLEEYWKWKKDQQNEEE